MKGLFNFALIFVLVASVLNVAVAWGCSVLSGTPKFDAHITASYRRQRFEQEDRNPQLKDEVLWIERVLHSGQLDVVVIQKEQPTDQKWHEHRAGWPFRSMVGRELFDINWATLDDGFEWALPIDSNNKLSRATSSKTGSSRDIIPATLLPMRPVWSGFAINTGLYSLVLFVSYSLWWLSRRFIRNLRGRCLKCGYDLRGDLKSGCSECGWRRAEILKTHTA